MMKKGFKLVPLLFSAMIMLAACGSGEEADSTQAQADENGIKTFSAFMAVPGKEVPSDNRVYNEIANRIGAKADVTWLTGQTASERVGVMAASGEYPDLVDASDGTTVMLEAGGYIPIEDYLDDYPNIKNLYSEEEWNLIRNEDGHIYYIPQFGNIMGENKEVQTSGEAFWIQKRVLKWANYPEITTVDEYFKVIGDFLAENPESDGQKNVGFSIISDDWRYFSLENPPMFLAGYPNDGAGLVDPETLEVSVYDTIPEAKEYFKILNEQYNKGIIDPETFTMSYDQYIAKIASGRVVGMIDQYWQFQDANSSLVSQGKDELTYVPLDLVLDESVTPKYYDTGVLNVGSGLGITISCDDVEGALQFINDLLDPEILVLRSWGEEGIDYEVGEDGLFYRTEEQRANARDTDYALQNHYTYNYFPTYIGTFEDGNAISPAEQPAEFYDGLVSIDKEVLDAYGYEKWTDFLNPVPVEENGAWYPIYSATSGWASNSPEAIANEKMTEVKQQWLPRVIMGSVDDFEKNWTDYMTTYEKQVDVEAYEKALTEEVKRRVEISEGKN